MTRRHLLVLGLLLGISLPVSAQSTGSSFGGGGFGGGGSHSGSSHSSGGSSGSSHSSGGSSGSSGSSHNWGSSGSSSHSYSGSSHSYSGSSGSSSDWFFIAVIAIVAIGVWFLRVGGVASSGRRSTPTHVVADTFAMPMIAPARQVDVSAVTIAVDWRDRRALQDKLEQLAKSGDTSTPGGLARMLHEVVIALRRIEKSWLYAGAVNFAPASEREAETAFQNVAAEMRSRYQHELVRAAHGEVTLEEAPALVARAEDGGGLVAVTLVVAAHGEIPDVAHAQNANHLRELMRVFGGIGPRLVALEVIWSPSKEEDRMSSRELEVLYPELGKIDEHTIAGRVFCGFCEYPYAAELARCPNCGGFAEGKS
jgi:uncharacterized membrane protein